MNLPSCFPNPQKNAKAIQGLLNRIRGLDQDAQDRLKKMLEDEQDLPFLDLLERECLQAFQRVAPERAAELRGRFITTLNAQRDFLLKLVLDELDGQLEESNSVQH